MPRRAALSAVLVIALGALWAAASPARHLPPPGHYVLAASRSQLSIHLYKSGWLSALGDNHLVVARRMRGVADVAADQWSGVLVVPSRDLRVADPHRSAHDRAEIQATMDGPSQLDIARYPRITWRLDALGSSGGEGRMILHGHFTMHGVTRRVDWRTHWAATKDGIRLWGRAYLRLTSFGIHPIHRALGAVSVRNRFLLTWNTWWRHTGPAAATAASK